MRLIIIAAFLLLLSAASADYCRGASGTASAPTEAARPAPERPPKPVKTAGKPAAPPASKKLFEACVREADNLKKGGDTALIEKKLASCSALAPRNPRIRTDWAEYLTRLGKYETAVEKYQEAAALSGASSHIAAYCHIKTAGIYFKLGDLTETIRYYAKALEINKNDINAMMGLAAASQAKGDLKTAGGLYARVLKAEPANAKARELLDEINLNLLSGSQLLDELRSRGAAYDDRTDASPEDVKLLRDIRGAERNGAVDYLRSKTLYTKDLIFEKREQGRISLMLTLAGFKSYQSYLTRDAINFFEKKNITLQDIFTLRDLKGRPIFDPGGRLTGEGMRTYWQAMTGEKNWLLHYEAVLTPVEEKPSPEEARLLKAGFKEISEAEYLWLMKATDCPDDVLRSAPCDIKLLQARQTVKYFLCYSPSLCSSEASKLTSYVARYRAGDTMISELTGSTAFFGTGGVAKRRFCYQGKIWNGE